jgi:WXG100 family type VII secretion target
MAEIKVTPQELRTKADSLQQYNANFRSEVEKMVGYVSQLSSMWEGEAKTAFEKAFNDDKPKMDAFAQNIDKYVQALQESAKQYEDAEQMAISLANQRSG